MTLAPGPEADILALLESAPPPGDELRALLIEIVRANARMVEAIEAPSPWRGLGH